MIENVQRIKVIASDAVGFIVGGLLGFLASLYARYAANAAVKVRPNLADVGFIEASVTNHGHDWLFYHYPMAMTVITVIFGSLIIGVGWKSFGR